MSKRRNMKVICAVIFLGLYAIPPVNGKCNHDEVEICSMDFKDCVCETCKSCPAGYGPSHHCGGQYLNGTVITCEPCIIGVTYSKERSISSCQPCNQCGGKETLRRCTTKRDTSCGTKCRVGFIMDNALELCLPDPSFKTTPRHVDKLKLQTTALLPETTTIPRTTTSMTQADEETIRETNGMHTTKQTHLDTSGKKRQPNSNSLGHSKDIKIIVIVTLIVLVVLMALVIFVVVLYYRRCHHPDNARKKKNQDEQVALTEQSPRSSQDSVQWPDNLCLRDIKHTLRSDIANHISGNSTVLKGWRDIGEKAKLSPNELQAIDVAGQKRNTNQGEELFTKILSAQPEFTLNEFVEILEGLGRKDVVDLIKVYYNNENKVNTATQNLYDNHDDV